MDQTTPPRQIGEMQTLATTGAREWFDETLAPQTKPLRLKRGTALMETPRPDLIDDFLDSYKKSYDFWKTVADECADRCRAILDTNGIRAIVTDRAKDPERLKQKIENRTKTYVSRNDIEQDIADLAGVRVALYYPGDLDATAALFHLHFDNVRVKEFPLKGVPSPRRFLGYRATHLRVQLKPDSLDDRYAAVSIEVQIASLFMHAWAEVDHDLLYKPLYGTPSPEEIAALDELNGLSLIAELALERLQKLTVGRRESEIIPFANPFALASFIHDYLAVKFPKKQISMNLIKELHAFLRLIRKDTPAAVKALLDDLDIEPDFYVPQQIEDSLVFGSLAAYDKLGEARGAVWSFRPFQLGAHDLEGYGRTKHRFIVSWIALQQATYQKLGQKPINKVQWENARQRLLKFHQIPFLADQLIFHESYEEFRKVFHSLVGADVSQTLPALHDAVKAITATLDDVPAATVATILEHA